MNRLRAFRLLGGYKTRESPADAIFKAVGEDENKEVSAVAITCMEEGWEQNQPWNVVDTLADFFQVSPSYLMGTSNIDAVRNKPMGYGGRGNRLKELRERAGYTSSWALEEAIKERIQQSPDEGMTVVTSPVLSCLEGGEENPRWNTVDTLSKFFDVTPDYLMGVSDKPTLTPTNHFSEHLAKVI